MRLLALAAVVILCARPVLGGTNGILEGTVTDKRNGELIPGVNVLVLPNAGGAVTNANGYFVIPGLRAGKYELRVSHVGHQTVILRGVIINPDLRTRVSLELDPADVTLDEVVVLQEKPLIQKDVTGTTYVLVSEDLAPLPIDYVVDAVRLKAGVTNEGNFRGGKSSEVMYLVDGLPVQDVLSGGISAQLPNSSITGLSVYTGGFDAEYGNALSGVVNIISRTGGEQQRWFVRADNDHLFGGTQNSKRTQFELSACGPLLAQQMFYLVALNGDFSGTRWWQDLKNFFKSPIDRTFNGFAKIDYSFSPTMRLGTQVLFSRHEWRDYEFSWRYNLDGLPPERRTSYRIAAILNHTLSPTLSYTASLSRFFAYAEIGEGDKNQVPVDDPYQYDFFLRYVVAGKRALWASNKQESYTAKAEFSMQATPYNIFRFGGELTLYNLNADIVKYEPRRTYFGKPLVNAPQLDYSSAYAYHPATGALYVQSKADIPEEHVLVNLGLRYEFLDPTANRPNIRAVSVADTAYDFAVASTTSASFKHQLSPRFGAAVQVTPKGYFFLNLGWYFQFPLFDYLYTGLDRVALARGVGALTGNPDLEPERSKLWEISFKYELPAEVVASITYFRKESTNLVDSKTFVPGDSKLAGDFGFAEYVNNPYAQSEGLEVLITRERGEWVTGELSYAYLDAVGLSGSTMDGYYIAQYGLPPGRRIYPMSWDQRHTVKAVLSVKMPWKMSVNAVGQWHTGRPYTFYPTSTGFEKIDGGRFLQNNARLPEYANLDLKVEQEVRAAWWPDAMVKFYLDVRNVFDRANVVWEDSNGRVGGELDDPSGYVIGRRTAVGVQVEF
jgi:outer membrane receptor protein involved in Fe transport